MQRRLRLIRKTKRGDYPIDHRVAIEDWETLDLWRRWVDGELDFDYEAITVILDSFANLGKRYGEKIRALKKSFPSAPRNRRRKT